MHDWEQNFDEFIRSSIGEHQVPYNPEHWAAMQDRLLSDGLMDSAHTEDLDSFDSQLESELDTSFESFETQWDSFESSLVVSEALDDISFDAQVREELQRAEHQEIVSDDSWNQFQSHRKGRQIDLINIYGVKIMEVSLILLLLWTLYNYPLSQSRFESYFFNENSQAEVDLRNSRASNEDREPIESFSQVSNTDIVSLSSFPSENEISIQSITPVLSLETKQPLAIIDNEEVELNSVILSSSIGDFPPLDAYSLNAIPLIGPDLHQSDSFIEQKKKTYFSKIGVFVGGDLNFIQSAYNKIVEHQPDIIDSVGYGLGLTYSYGNLKWAVESGVIFFKKSYVPDLPDVVTDEFPDINYESFDRVNLSIIQVPVYARANFYGQDIKSNAYVRLGGALNTVIKSDFDINKYDTPNKAMIRRALRPSESSFFDANEKNLEPNTFWENSFLTMNVALGFERYLGYRSAVFFEVDYQQHVYKDRGYGPNSDRPNSLSFRLGVNYRFLPK